MAVAAFLVSSYALLCHIDHGLLKQFISIDARRPIVHSLSTEILFTKLPHLQDANVVDGLASSGTISLTTPQRHEQQLVLSVPIAD